MVFLGHNEKYIPDIISCSIFKGKKRHKILMWSTKDVLDYFSLQKCRIRKSGTVIEIGQYLTFQRKGGDGGKKQANQFQFKAIISKIPNPLYVKIFDN